MTDIYLRMYSTLGAILLSLKCLFTSIWEYYFPTNINWENETALITGAAGGLGRSVCQELINRGCKSIVITDINNDRLESLKNYHATHNPKVVINSITCDLSKSTEIDKFLTKLWDCGFSTTTIIHCAAIRDQISNFKDDKTQELGKIHMVNVLSFFKIVQSVLPQMMKKNHGYVVAVSSVFSRHALNFVTGYSMSKSSLERLMDSFQHDCYIKGLNSIQFMVVSPGKIDTELFEDFEYLYEIPYITKTLSPTGVAQSILGALSRKQGSLNLPCIGVPGFGFLKSILPYNAFQSLVSLITRETPSN